MSYHRLKFHVYLENAITYNILLPYPLIPSNPLSFLPFIFSPLQHANKLELNTVLER